VTQGASKICELTHQHKSAAYVKKMMINGSERRGLQLGPGTTDI